MKSTFALLVVLATCCSTAAAQRNESIPVTDVTISDLVSNPDFYSNVVVRVRGASVLRFEGEFICESPDEIDNEKGHCVWLEPVAKNGILGALDPDIYHNKVVLLTGVFDKDYRAIGRMSGAIAPIHSVVIGEHTKGDILQTSDLSGVSAHAKKQRREVPAGDRNDLLCAVSDPCWPPSMDRSRNRCRLVPDRHGFHGTFRINGLRSLAPASVRTARYRSTIIARGDTPAPWHVQHILGRRLLGCRQRTTYHSGFIDLARAYRNTSTARRLYS